MLPLPARKESFFDLLPNATVVLDEPDTLNEVHDGWWTQSERSP